MNMIRLVESFNLFLAVLFTVAYFYQLVYLAIGLVKRRRWKQAEAAQYHRYAAVISARNEAGVIGELIQSLKQQNYPAHLLDIYVVADNCTDDTAQVSRRAGAIVYERFNQSKKGKGYALNFLFRTLAREGRDQYDAYFIFDADNLVDPNFVLEMNKVYDQGGYGAITCYRNSRNFGANWISAGYAIWFLREARFLNFPRMLLGTNCHVSGTGFLISADVIRENKGWPYHLLTEDIEFSANSILEGTRISYTPTAVLYDEQPITFRDSWNQRFRWAKGFYQVFWHYGARLAKGIAVNPKGARFACYDMLMTIAPGMLLSIISILFNTIIIVLAATGVMSTGVAIASSVTSVVFCLCNYIVFMFVFGVLTTFVEWDSIRTTTAKKIRYMFTFPFFMLTYIPIALVALVKKCKWKPIQHSISVDVAEFSDAANSKRERTM